ncbi:hypothetical protein CSOJ01_10585 [Colletotrichum sojae]|uniref:Uncharacterized protein n=1 Tax=Colletotrichum sojae TaxID=2175907 RepID=A0A8H6MPW0_9PEZI|nr:hypothetical protein CSOJ01_10585 [Colletotrichum sojae]
MDPTGPDFVSDRSVYELRMLSLNNSASSAFPKMPSSALALNTLLDDYDRPAFDSIDALPDAYDSGNAQRILFKPDPKSNPNPKPEPEPEPDTCA